MRGEAEREVRGRDDGTTGLGLLLPLILLLPGNHKMPHPHGKLTGGNIQHCSALGPEGLQGQCNTTKLTQAVTFRAARVGCEPKHFVLYH